MVTKKVFNIRTNRVERKVIKEEKQGKQDLVEFVKVISKNQRTLHELIMNLNIQIRAIEMRINLIERRLEFIDGGHYNGR